VTDLVLGTGCFGWHAGDLLVQLRVDARYPAFG
jgi:hypothetical protein